MELEKQYKNNQFNFGYDLCKLVPEKPAETFFKEALQQTIERIKLKDNDKVKIVFLYEDTNCCTKFYIVENAIDKEFSQDDFYCIDFNTTRTNKNEFNYDKMGQNLYIIKEVKSLISLNLFLLDRNLNVFKYIRSVVILYSSSSNIPIVNL